MAKISIPHLPICAQRSQLSTFDQNFNFNLRRDPQKKKKKSYECRVYESVDEKSLSYAMSQKTMKKRIRAKMG